MYFRVRAKRRCGGKGNGESNAETEHGKWTLTENLSRVEALQGLNSEALANRAPARKTLFRGVQGNSGGLLQGRFYLGATWNVPESYTSKRVWVYILS